MDRAEQLHTDNKPSREPDVVLPMTSHFKGVRIWVKEGLFLLEDEYGDDSLWTSISAQGNRYYNPFEYLNYIISYSGPDREAQKQAAMSFITTYYFEREVLEVDNGEFEHHGS